MATIEIEIPPDVLPRELQAIARELLALPEVAALDDISNDLSKALRPGGRAHEGRDAAQVLADRAAAARTAESERVLFVERLREIKDAWLASVALHDAARGALGEEAAAKYLEPIRRQVERAARDTIRRSYASAWRLGRQHGGNFRALGRDEQAQLLRLQREEQQLFLNLLLDVEAGTYSLDLNRRIELYGQALGEAFGLGFLHADLSPDRWVRWCLKPQENCVTCVKLSKGGRYRCGVYRARELAARNLVPRSSKLLCYAGCGCTLAESEKPSGPATGEPLAAMVLEGESKDRSGVFRGLGRMAREKLAARAESLRLNWKGRRSMNPPNAGLAPKP